jgi:hypothetical protein
MKKSIHRVFVKGEIVSTGGIDKPYVYFSDGKEISTNSDDIRDIITLALDPFEAYRLQIESLPKGCYEIKDVVEILVALQFSAQARLNDFVEHLTRHVGIPMITRVSSCGNNHLTVSDPLPDDVIGVEFVHFGDEKPDDAAKDIIKSTIAPQEARTMLSILQENEAKNLAPDLPVSDRPAVNKMFDKLRGLLLDLSERVVSHDHV